VQLCSGVLKSEKIMNFIAALIQALGKSAEQRDQERKVAYLSEAIDLYELEFRMRKLDREVGGYAVA
jgi:hypothetical protein